MTEVKSRVCLISTARHDPDFPINRTEDEVYSNHQRIQIMTYRALKVRSIYLINQDIDLYSRAVSCPLSDPLSLL